MEFGPTSEAGLLLQGPTHPTLVPSALLEISTLTDSLTMSIADFMCQELGARIMAPFHVAAADSRTTTPFTSTQMTGYYYFFVIMQG